MTHGCPDGTHTKLVRDPSVPVGKDANLSCPRCGYVYSASEHERARRVLKAYAAR